MPGEGVFVDFFGRPACTTTGIARVALHTDAAVVPGYAYWDENLRKYRLRFEPPVELVRTGNTERDVLENTQRFAKVIEEIIRKHPEQWVWIHARWKNTAEGRGAGLRFSVREGIGSSTDGALKHGKCGMEAADEVVGGELAKAIGRAGLRETLRWSFPGWLRRSAPGQSD